MSDRAPRRPVLVLLTPRGHRGATIRATLAAATIRSPAVRLRPGADPFSHDGGPVGALVLHGLTSSPRSVLPWAEHLAAAGLTVELPRLPGHGTQWQDMAVTRWEDWYAEVDRTFSSLRDRCDTVVVMGLGMGGSLALRLAERRPDEMAGLVLVNPAVHTEDRRLVLLPVLKHIIRAIPSFADDIKMPGQQEGAYDRLPLRSFDSLHRAWGTIKADIARVSAPLLVLHSREDHVVEPSNAAWVLTHVSSPDRTELWLEDSYHVATRDNDARLVLDTSLEFVHRLARRTPGA